MLDHVSIMVSDFEKSKSFYKAVLGPLGYKMLMEFPGVAGFGPEGPRGPAFWIGQADRPSSGGHIAFQAPSRDAVGKFHAAGLASGGKDEGAPGLRTLYHPTYYAAFLWDPDGYKVEAVIHT